MWFSGDLGILLVHKTDLRNSRVIVGFIFEFQRALSFLNNDGSLRHNSVSIWSVFVNSAGEWKLGGLEFVQSVDVNNQHNITLIPVKIPPALEIYVSIFFMKITCCNFSNLNLNFQDPPEKNDSAKLKNSTKWYSESN